MAKAHPWSSRHGADLGSSYGDSVGGGRIMNRMMTARLPGALILLFSLGLPNPGAGQDSMMAGRWALNADESDDVQRQIERGTRRNNIVEIRRRGDPAPSPRLDRATPLAAALLKYVARDATRLVLIHTDSTATVMSSDGTVLVYPIDGPGRAVLSDGVDVGTKAEWRGGELRLEARVDGGRIEEKYELDEDTGSLKVEVRLVFSDRGLNIRIRRTYDRVPDEG